MNADDAPIRVYVREGGSLRNVAACGIDDLGFCLLTLREEREIEGKLVGIMYRPEPDKPGVWLSSPFALPGAEPVEHDPGQLRIRA